MWIYRLKIDFVFMRVCIVVHMFPPYFYLLLITPWQCREIFINAWRIFVYPRIIVSRPWALCTCLYICDLCLVGISTSTLEKNIFSKNLLYTCTVILHTHAKISHLVNKMCSQQACSELAILSSCYKVVTHNLLTNCWILQDDNKLMEQLVTSLFNWTTL